MSIKIPLWRYLEINRTFNCSIILSDFIDQIFIS